MAPKQKQTKQDTKKDTKKDDKATKQTLQVRASADDGGQKSPPLPAMDVAELKRFLGHMKYHGGVGADPDTRAILSAYNDGTPEEKRSLLAKFKVNGKDLKWVRNMSASTADSTELKEGFVEDWYLRNETFLKCRSSRRSPFKKISSKNTGIRPCG